MGYYIRANYMKDLGKRFCEVIYDSLKNEHVLDNFKIYIEV